MTTLAAVSGIALILVVLWDGFETIVLPRRVTRKIRLARFFYRFTWRIWSRAVGAVSAGNRKETWFGYYGPMSLLMLLSLWGGCLIFGFSLLQWADGSQVNTQGGNAGFWTDFYLSATTFFTLGLGDVTPRSTVARVLTAAEGGLGFGFLALVIGYLPALNQSFSRREVNISLLDARAGSPPSAAEMLRRHAGEYGLDALQELLAKWETWSAELMESHLSYPVLAYFRSQHDNQSWLSALTTVMDTCALTMVGLDGVCERQARLTFEITRHAVLDLSHVFGRAPSEPEVDRLPPEGLAELRAILSASGFNLPEGEDVGLKLAEIRAMYEPYVYSLSRFLHMSLPPWMPGPGWEDNWQTSAWRLGTGPRGPGLPRGGLKHF
ncbi:MAG: potassium channel family protein [Nitrospirota bacterium]